MNMGERIKQLRIANGLTQEELGKYIGVQKAAIRKYEKGEVKNINTTTKGLFDYHKEKKDIKIRQMIVHLPLIIFIYDYPTGI